MIRNRLCSFCCVLILCQASIKAAAFDEKRIGFTVPAAPWTLTLPKDDFVIVQQQFKPDGRNGYFFIIDDQKHVNVSMFIEPAEQCKDSKSCRDMVWKMGNPAWVNPQNVVQSEIGDVGFFELNSN